MDFKFWNLLSCEESERQVTDYVSVQRAASDCEDRFYRLLLFLLFSLRAAFINIKLQILETLFLIFMLFNLKHTSVSE